MTENLQGLSKHARVELDSSIRPLEKLTRLSESLGIDLLVKRDDVSTFAFGGNKVRQLEFYLGPACRQNADTVLITGAVQSNFVRLCAAAAARLGMHPIVQLEHRVPSDDPLYNSSGNVLLNQLLGAEIHYFDEGENEAAADANLDRMADKLRADGRNPYVIHLGVEHPPIGALGYSVCAHECYVQLTERNQVVDHVVIPSGSGLTHSGFLAGARAIGWNVPVQGICVRRDATQQRQRINRRVADVMRLLGEPVKLSDDDVQVHDTVLAPGYGQMNDALQRAIDLSARQEALLLDPVYSGRTMAGLIALIENGTIQPGASVLFIHTGGLAALFAYQNTLQLG